MDIERKHVYRKWDEDKAEDAEEDMRCKFDLRDWLALVVLQRQSSYLWHFQVTEFVPEVLNGVQTNKRGAEQAHPFHTADTTNRNTSQHQP